MSIILRKTHIWKKKKIRLKTEEREQRLRTAMMEKDAYIDYLTGGFHQDLCPETDG